MGPRRQPEPEHCELCGRRCLLTFHHLIPRKMRRRPFFKKSFDKARLESGAFLCRLCHQGLHRLHDEMTLGRELNTLARLRADPAVARHIAWVRRQKVAGPDRPRRGATDSTAPGDHEIEWS